MSPLLRTLIIAVLAGAALAQAGEERRVATRFGVLTVDGRRVLLFEGRPVEPQVQGNSGLDLGEPIRMGDADVVVVKNVGGTACPFLYRFLTVDRTGAKATREFGTCNEIVEIRSQRHSIVVSMHGYRGPFESASERRRAARKKHIFEFKDGVVAEKTASAK